MSDNRIYRIGGMDCAHCAQEVESGVAKLEGVRSVRVDFATGKMTLDADVPFDQLEARVTALGKSIAPDAEDAPEALITSRGGILGFWDYLASRHETRLALWGGAGVVLTLMLSLLGLPETLTALFYTLAMAVTLLPIARSGINALRINHEFNINLLMTIAAIGAIAIGEHLEAATVIFLFAIGESLEGYTANRARDSIRSLMSLKPPQAVRLRKGQEEVVPVGALNLGDLLLVKAGEHIPMDAIVTSGVSTVNQAPITGESMPVSKTAGDTVFAGTINGEGLLTLRVTRLAADNTLSRIIRLVEEAQSVRAPSQRLIDQFARWYTPAVVVIALMIAFLPPLLFQQPFYDTPDQHGWLYRALSMLVIACPCALVISAPVTIISAITAAARRGVLIKGGAFLEALATIKAFAFDKTGTLTEGSPAVTGWRSFACEQTSDCAACNDVLSLAAALERRATHPLAQAVVRAAEDRALFDQYAPADSVEVLAGRGLRGQLNGHTIAVGSHRMFEEAYPHSRAVCDMIDAAEASGQTTMLVAEDQDVRGMITIADRVRQSSKQVIGELHALGIASVMLTGDNRIVGEQVGSELGISETRAELLPEDKVAAINDLKARYGSVAMVGDGVNDTPSLAAATVGIAMGGAGTPQALETADVALMADDLAQLPFIVRLARFARSIILQNIAFSFVLKAVFLLLALMGLTSLWAAVLADVGMSLLVTLNGMRPLAASQVKG